jgi:hypothetical protein
MHGYHSNARGPSWPAFVRAARAARLDFLPVTEYVVGNHWNELGAPQRANPDLEIWPSREVITYFGHATVFGETPSTLEYRHGFRGIRLRDVQARAKADGALFGVAHPTIFPGPLFASFCRGCEFQLGDDIDWRKVDTIEVLTSAVLSGTADIGLPATPPRTENPFVRTAIDLWESLLDRGFKITAVSGSDSKGQSPGPTLGYGVNATEVYARELSRPALADAVRAGHAYVRTRGVADSPALEMTARAPDGRTGMFGDTLRADRADVTVHVRGGDGQFLRVIRGGDTVSVVPIAGGDFTYRFAATRRAEREGPLGTWWRVETFDARSRTTFGNPIFLRAPR